jgi:hypothetical protein
MESWPHHLPSGNQKRFQRDPEKRKAFHYASGRALLFTFLPAVEFGP